MTRRANKQKKKYFLIFYNIYETIKVSGQGEVGISFNLRFKIGFLKGFKYDDQLALYFKIDSKSWESLTCATTSCSSPLLIDFYDFETAQVPILIYYINHDINQINFVLQ
ncbi:unnamed protein product (macronuclear) [Paramecium tetraurelia]|uniref:Uncharacterized protein n=1 Tax=Paramecium tetraurelia TaxID=5888 RepID=A0E7G5_PARTE|nr:uncharacterized protein GSPATT00023960001 [Paramecium tetraurelia]CAK91232.1 unnamed protein product [Paramecium tetraurelia]|eukprot:XP_001458629.1 hypothetical protein (macronuclear) [Paramecium tetraurelia strain d4-2]